MICFKIRLFPNFDTNSIETVRDTQAKKICIHFDTVSKGQIPLKAHTGYLTSGRQSYNCVRGMPRTRSQSGIAKQAQIEFAENSAPKRRRVLTKQDQEDDTKMRLISLRPKFDSKPSRKTDIITDFDVLRKKKTLDQSIILQLEQLKKFEIFKDMNIDIKTVSILASDVGDYDEKDQKLLKLMEKGDSASDEEWMELYGIEI